MAIDVLERDNLQFPRSLPEFQYLFPNEVACATYLEYATGATGSCAVTAVAQLLDISGCQIQKTQIPGGIENP